MVMKSFYVANHKAVHAIHSDDKPLGNKTQQAMQLYKNHALWEEGERKGGREGV